MQTDICIAANAWGIDYADTGSPRFDYWLSKSSRTHRHAPSINVKPQWNSTLELQVRADEIMAIHPRVAQESKICGVLATLHNTRQMAYHQVRYGSLKAILILDPADIETANWYSALCYYSVQ